MSHANFVHLRVHTAYSLLEGALHPADLVRLCQKYAQQPAVEWPALFQRILQNRILDWHRRQTRWQRWFIPWKGSTEDEAADAAVDTIVDERDQNPERLLVQADDMEIVLGHLEQLPLRQQQAFLLRVWEGLDVKSTAKAMQCSESAVKTHFHRATRSLRNALETP